MQDYPEISMPHTIHGNAQIVGNFDPAPGDEPIELIYEPDGRSAVTVNYKVVEKRGRRGSKKKPITVAKKWNSSFDGKIDRVAVANDGMHKVLFLYEGSDEGVMLAYSKGEDRYSLLPITLGTFKRLK